MFTDIFGWLTFTGILLTSTLYIQNLINPEQGEKRVKIHCTIGKLTIITLTGHLLSHPVSGWSQNWDIWAGLGLYLIIMASGIVLLYIPNAGVLRYHARSLHPALVIGLAFSLAHHILLHLGLI